MNDTLPYEAVGKIIRIITCFVDESQQWGVRELAEHVGQSKSTVHRILTSLTLLNWLTYDENIRKYKLGFELFRITTLLSQQTMPLIPVVRPYLERIGEITGEAVIFCFYDHKANAVIFLDMVESRHPLRYAINLGAPNELYAGATGRSILAFLPKKTQTAIIQAGLKSFTVNTAKDSQELLQKLIETQKLGYSVSYGERISGAVSVAAPFWDNKGVVGSIALTVPEQRITSDGTIEEWGQLLIQETERLTLQLSSFI